MIVDWLRQNPKILTRLAELITVNGGQPQVRRIVGQPQPTEAHRYKRDGITMSEAVELAYIHGGFDILCSLSKEDDCLEAKRMIEKEMAGEQQSLIVMAKAEDIPRWLPNLKTG